jgi:hypothetical protein
MNKIFNYSIIALSFLILLSCKKNQVGGSATVKGVVSHHGKAIADAYVYIKYDATEFPGDDYTLYNTFVKADGSGNYSIPLYKGNYYIYARGYDYAIPSPYIVKGGLSVSVRSSENLTKDIAVSE